MAIHSLITTTLPVSFSLPYMYHSWPVPGCTSRHTQSLLPAILLILTTYCQPYLTANHSNHSWIILYKNFISSNFFTSFVAIFVIFFNASLTRLVIRCHYIFRFVFIFSFFVIIIKTTLLSPDQMARKFDGHQ